MISRAENEKVEIEMNAVGADRGKTGLGVRHAMMTGTVNVEEIVNVIEKLTVWSLRSHLNILEDWCIDHKNSHTNNVSFWKIEDQHIHRQRCRKTVMIVKKQHREEPMNEHLLRRLNCARGRLWSHAGRRLSPGSTSLGPWKVSGSTSCTRTSGCWRA